MKESIKDKEKRLSKTMGKGEGIDYCKRLDYRYEVKRFEGDRKHVYAYFTANTLGELIDDLMNHSLGNRSDVEYKVTNEAYDVIKRIYKRYPDYKTNYNFNKDIEEELGELIGTTMLNKIVSTLEE